MLAATCCLTTVYAGKSQKIKINIIDAQIRNFYAGIKDAKYLIKPDFEVKAQAISPNFSYLMMNDFDKDGIPDKYDLCPEKPGVFHRRGCPEWDFRKIVSFAREKMRISQNDCQIIINVFANLKIDDNMSIMPESAKELDRFVALMKRNRHWNISISSHFDKARTDRKNTTVSEQRLNAIIDYLHKKGLAANRIKGYFFGASRQVTDLPATRFEVEIKY